MDKQIHRNEFRLRILMTNECNKSCYHCLNDFQDSKEPRYVDVSFAKIVISEYNKFCIDKSIKPIISFSGGEPTLHKDIRHLLGWTEVNTEARIQVNTNGAKYYKISDVVGESKQIKAVFGVTEEDPKVLNWLKDPKNSVQIVLTEKNIGNYWSLIFYYYEQASSIKIFVDFFNHILLKASYIDLEEVAKADKLDKLQFRYTGIQENRGPGCGDCQKDCITLKATWVFPDNTITACPQRQKGYVYHPQNSEWGIRQSLFSCYYFHKV